MKKFAATNTHSSKISQFPELISLITDNINDTEIISQIPDTVSIHDTDKKWLFLSREIGYFNRITQFITGDKSSVQFLDASGNFCSPNISDVIKDLKNYYMIYPIPINNLPQNKSILFSTESEKYQKNINTEIKIDLTFHLGYTLGRKIFLVKPFFKLALTSFETAINGSDDESRFWPNKNLLLNGNIDFLLGILFGYLHTSYTVFNSEDSENTEKTPKRSNNKIDIFLQKTDNIYIFTTILNLIGANYSFNKIPLKYSNCEDYEECVSDKKMHLNIPNYFLKIFKKYINDYPELNIYLNLFRYKEFFYSENKTFQKNSPYKITKENNTGNANGQKGINNLILNGKVILLSMSSFKILDVTKEHKDLELFDFSMPRGDATNYSLAFTPLLKNSDGDILTMSSIFGSEAIDDAEVFAPEHKEWFRDLNTGAISNYIADDAVLGLFAATKYL